MAKRKYYDFETYSELRPRLYNIWVGMKQRIHNPNCREYPEYGGRGLTMYSKWKNDFLLFRKWAMNHGYSDSLSIDRINNDIGYYPWNCRWATSSKQGSNKRNNVKVIYDGLTLTLSEWSRKTNIPYETLRSRYKYGWDAKDILSK